MTPAEHRLPVTIVAGLCEGARRAAIGDLLHSVPGTVVLHHDLSAGPNGSVHRTIRDLNGLVGSGHAPLVNDCACCALREDLVPELLRLAEAGTYRLAVVELWDSVEPQAMAAVIAAESESLALTGVATAIDPALVLPCLSNGDDLAEAGLAAAPPTSARSPTPSPGRSSTPPCSPSPKATNPRTTPTKRCLPSSPRPHGMSAWGTAPWPAP